MIAVDTNILVYAHREDSPWHRAAAERVAELAEGPVSWGVPWSCMHEFFAIVTHPRIYTPPTLPTQAVDQIEAWLESPTLTLLSESSTHWPTLRALLAGSRLSGPSVHDARIAAVCLQHGVRELWTADRDFSRFPNLKTRNPLIV